MFHWVGTDSNFANPDYLVVYCWVNASFLHSNMINPTEPSIYYYTKLFEGVVRYTPLGCPCTQTVAVINYSNAALPFAATAFPVS